VVSLQSVGRKLLTVGWPIAVVVLLPLLSLFTPPAAEAVTGVSLTPSLPSGQLVGTTITWVASATGSGTQSPVYRFVVAPAGGTMTALRDYSTQNTFDWTPIDEGTYSVMVSVRDGFGVPATTNVVATFVVTSRVTGTSPVVTSAANPLVALYSAPPCAAGTMRVDFRAVDDQTTQSTSSKACQAGNSVNFWVAGMRAGTTYYLQQVLVNGSTQQRGAVVPYTTGTPSTSFPAFVVRDPADAQTSLTDDLVLHTLTIGPGDSTDTLKGIATDLAGRVVWYLQTYPVEFPTRVVPGGTMLMIGSIGNRKGQRAIEVDLAGNTLRETNVARINEQLASLGQDPIIEIHHEVMRLPNGNTALLGYVERLHSNVQGATGTVDVLGTNLVVLDANWQVSWVWNAFQHLDVNRAATLGEKGSVTNPVCPALQLATTANDWLHANTIAYSTTDGNLLVSLRNQDWVVKIDYRDGAGTGDVVWRLGKGGDFNVLTLGAYAWFSHQHDVDYASPVQLTLFDNGNTRCQKAGPSCHSRGQVLSIDETKRIVTLRLNADVGSYSGAWGTAERLRNGNYHFTSGQQFPGPIGQSVEVLPDGTIDYVLEAGAGEYRSFRLKSLYEP